MPLRILCLFYTCRLGFYPAIESTGNVDGRSHWLCTPYLWLRVSNQEWKKRAFQLPLILLYPAAICQTATSRRRPPLAPRPQFRRQERGLFENAFVPLTQDSFSREIARIQFRANPVL